MIEVKNLNFSYPSRDGKINVLKDISFNLNKGESCAIIGPSGCGKTTLLYLLSGLFSTSDGEIIIGGEPVQPKRKNTALILQEYGLFPWKTVWENTVLGLVLRKTPRNIQYSIGKSILEELGLWDAKDRFPFQLSGGQRQRIAIARAIAISPDLLLMDEPFSSLDAMTREILQDTLLGIWKKRKMTFIIVTHSIEEAVLLGQRIIVLSALPGAIIENFESLHRGEKGYRMSEDYFELCNYLRKTLKLWITENEK